MFMRSHTTGRIMISPLLQSTLNIAQTKIVCHFWLVSIQTGLQNCFEHLNTLFCRLVFLATHGFPTVQGEGPEVAAAISRAPNMGRWVQSFGGLVGLPPRGLGWSRTFLDVGADVLLREDSPWLLCLKMPAGFADCQTRPLLRHLPPAFAALPWQEDASTWDWCGKRRFFANVEGSIVGLFVLQLLRACYVAQPHKQTRNSYVCCNGNRFLFSSTQAAECTIIVYKLSLPYRALCGVFEFFILVSSHSCSLVFDGIFWWSSLSLITPASVMLQKYEVTITSFNEVVASCMFANSEPPAERILHPSQK